MDIMQLWRRLIAPTPVPVSMNHAATSPVDAERVFSPAYLKIGELAAGELQHYIDKQIKESNPKTCRRLDIGDLGGSFQYSIDGPGRVSKEVEDEIIRIYLDAGWSDVTFVRAFVDTKSPSWTIRLLMVL